MVVLGKHIGLDVDLQPCAWVGTWLVEGVEHAAPLHTLASQANQDEGKTLPCEPWTWNEFFPPASPFPFAAKRVDTSFQIEATP